MNGKSKLNSRLHWQIYEGFMQETRGKDPLGIHVGDKKFFDHGELGFIKPQG